MIYQGVSQGLGAVENIAFPEDPLSEVERQQQLDAGMPEDDSIMDQAAPYLDAGLDPAQAEFAAKLEEENAAPPQLPAADALPPPAPHMAWDVSQHVNTAAGAAAAPWTAGLSIPASQLVNVGIRGLKKLFG